MWPRRALYSGDKTSLPPPTAIEDHRQQHHDADDRSEAPGAHTHADNNDGCRCDGD